MNRLTNGQRDYQFLQVEVVATVQGASTVTTDGAGSNFQYPYIAAVDTQFGMNRAAGQAVCGAGLGDALFYPGLRRVVQL